MKRRGAGVPSYWKWCPECARAWMEERNNFTLRTTCVRCGSTRLDRKNHHCMDCRSRQRMESYYRQALDRYWQKVGLS
jgi:ribosomal protein S27AE